VCFDGSWDTKSNVVVDLNASMANVLVDVGGSLTIGSGVALDVTGSTVAVSGSLTLLQNSSLRLSDSPVSVQGMPSPSDQVTREPYQFIPLPPR